MAKERLDALLVNRGLFESRTRAQAAVMAGQVLVNEQKIDKPGTQVSPDVTIRLLGDKLRYVSRGGLKLEKALQIFPISVEGKVVADIGASTGGFTHCLLHYGASKVYALDCGHSQLSPMLIDNEKVINIEKTNARNITKEMFEKIDFSGKIKKDEKQLILYKIFWEWPYENYLENGEIDKEKDKKD